MRLKYWSGLLGVLLVAASCGDDKITNLQEENKEAIEVAQVVVPDVKFGYDYNEFEVISDTVKSGDTFGDLIDDHL
ncbi:MAG: hypothetical protein WBA16_11185, partial [Nonlabens sp.]